MALLSPIAFQGTALKRGLEKTDKFLEHIADIADFGRMPANSSYVFDSMGRAFVNMQAEDVIYTADSLISEAQRIKSKSKDIFHDSKFAVSEIKRIVKDSESRYEYYDDKTGYNVKIDGNKIKEFDENGVKVRETTLSEDKKTIEKIEFLKGNSLNTIERTYNGIKITKGLKHYQNGLKTARNIFYFDAEGNLTEYVKGYVSKTDRYGDNLYKQYDKKFQFRNGKIKRIISDMKIKPDKTTIKQDIRFTKTGAPKAIYTKLVDREDSSSFSQQYIFKEEEIKVEDSINNYETGYRLYKVNDKKPSKTDFVLKTF